MTAPFLSSTKTVKPEWIDYNGHLNMAYYNVLFDTSVDEVYADLGLGADYARTRGFTTYTAEFHICYVRELHEGDRVQVKFQMIDHDDKRFHTYQELYHEDGWLAATGEALGLHIDMSGPRVAPFPPDIADKIAAMARLHADLPRPERVGRSIGIRRKSAPA
ncbi:thioesterase family protein [Sedimentitalea nanhaiensis]|uniref:(3S)-malyl-CoA thioesterase n=1 Tax=Sedimentitalea nanhaiensis TaxID=999627 RepID=A0A1I7D632_9RHOB|nr:thioesterase family protein [Sedimentitalea nanhaiensis]SFU07100.1 (3S)-malyl-CoA thioesterase [Sedimentitalea nanhaiensis]